MMTSRLNHAESRQLATLLSMNSGHCDSCTPFCIASSKSDSMLCWKGWLAARGGVAVKVVVVVVVVVDE